MIKTWASRDEDATLAWQALGVKAFAAALGIAARRAGNPNPNRSPPIRAVRIHSGSPCPNDPSPLRRNLPESRRIPHYRAQLCLLDQSSRLAVLVASPAPTV